MFTGKKASNFALWYVGQKRSTDGPIIPLTTKQIQITNKRMSIEAPIPSAPMIRRSDDNLNLNCKTEDGRTAIASVPSTMGGKIVASAVFLDFGIVDSITDKHREYPASYVVPVKK